MLKLGDRVKLHPATSAWVSGDRYGTVTRVHVVDGAVVHYKVHLDKSGKTVKIHPDNICKVIE